MSDTAVMEAPVEKKKRKPNPGKVFEKNFFASMPADVFFQRQKDDAKGFRGVKNGYDGLVFNGKKLFLLELKSHKGASIPVGALQEFQVNYLNEKCCLLNTIAGFIFNFREKENQTFFISGDVIFKAIYEEGLRSFNVEFCRTSGYEISSKLKKVHHSYDVQNLLDQYTN